MYINTSALVAVGGSEVALGAAEPKRLGGLPRLTAVEPLGAVRGADAQRKVHHRLNRPSEVAAVVPCG
jgi:hypothetical protein